MRTMWKVLMLAVGLLLLANMEGCGLVRLAQIAVVSGDLDKRPAGAHAIADWSGSATGTQLVFGQGVG